MRGHRVVSHGNHVLQLYKENGSHSTSTKSQPAAVECPWKKKKKKHELLCLLSSALLSMGNAWWMVWHFRACLFGCFTAIRSFAAAWIPGVIGTKWEERDRTLHAEKTEDRHSHRVIKHSRPAPPWPFQHGHGITMCCSGIHLSLYCTLDLSIWGEGFFAASLYNVPDEIVKVHLDMRLRQKSSDRHTQVQADLVYVRGAPLHWQHSTAHQTVTAISICPMP